MTDNATPGEKPAEANPESQGAQPAMSKESVEARLETMDGNELATALGFQPDSASPPKQAQDEPAPNAADSNKKPEESNPAATEQGAQPAEKPQEESKDKEEEDGKPTIRRRLSVTGLSEQDRELTAAAIAMVREGKAKDTAEAFRKLVPAPEGDPFKGGDSTPDGKSANPQDKPAARASAPALEQLQQEIDQAEQDLATAIKEYDQDKQIETQTKINRLNRELVKAELDAQAKAEKAQGYEQEYQAAVSDMEAKYADLLNDEGSPFSDMLEDRVIAARATNDPALAKPGYILDFAERIAKALKGSSPKAEKTPPSPVTPPPASPRGSQIAGSGKPASPVTKEQAEIAMQKMSAEDLAKAIWAS